MLAPYLRSALCLALILHGGCGPGGGTTDSDGGTTTGSGTGSSSSATSSTTASTAPTTGTTGMPGGPGPQESEFEVVVDALPFPLAEIGTITVGRKEFDESFANRGRVEVLFDHPEETITIELRKYAFGDPASAQETFDRLQLWAFVNTGDPTDPASRDPADDCTQDTWKDNCAIYAYYDGKSQPARTGIDFRVHLPTGYRGQLFAETEDNDAEPSYPRRGEVVVDNFCGGGEVALEAGRATVRMCADLTPAPGCLPADIQACEEYPDGTGSEAWSPACPCTPDRFGQLRVAAPQPWAANITVDVPAGVWMSAVLQNTSTMKPHECKPKFADCEPGACELDAADDYGPAAEFNHPSPAAPAGAGYQFTVVSGGCTEIQFVDSPDDWSPDQEPPSEIRGFVNFCTGCL